MAEQGDIERAAGKRRAALRDVDDRTQRQIDALLVERQGYVVRGLSERVAAVDEQIVALGGTAPRAPRARGEGTED